MMMSQLSQPKASISARDMGRNGAVPKRSAQYRRYPVMSRAVCMMWRGLDQKRRRETLYLGGPQADVKGGATRGCPPPPAELSRLVPLVLGRRIRLLPRLR